MNAVSLFFDLSFIYDSDYKALFLALKNATIILKKRANRLYYYIYIYGEYIDNL